jgi:hypothetical protein
VTVKYGDVQRVRLVQGSTSFTRFRVEDGGKLHIDACNNNCPHHYDLDIEITTPHIDALAVSGGGAIEGAAGFPPLGKMVMAVDGGGKIRYWGNPQVTQAVDGGGKVERGD